MKLIVLTKGQSAIVDDDMFEELNKYKWQAFKDSRKEKFYARRTVRVKGRAYNFSMAWLICPRVGGEVIDHINDNTLDNRRSNLRSVSNAENTWHKYHK